MTTKITVIYDSPTDPTVFEAAYPQLLVLAGQVPGVERLESSKVWPKEDGTPVPAYRLIDLQFADYAAASEAVTTPAADTFFTNAVELATGGVRIVFAEIEHL